MDGVNRHIPSEWKFPNLPLQHMYVYWHCGNQAKRISPIKNLDRRDLSAPGKIQKRGVRTFTELRRIMNAIDRAASAAGHPAKKNMVLAEANKCFAFGQDGIKVPTTTPSGKPRVLARLKWQSAVRLAPKGCLV